ncbi:hypothetical protein PAHAL_7G084200 [Panicum hallii]|uniref:Uncharacterized protein n=1 Tax=Panicum hallii TaxID=206008 RepID=A0A2T8IBG1_9POAL|nr:hypothetical protein PAHAL_7G084200 [Panicum hallii]
MRGRRQAPQRSSPSTRASGGGAHVRVAASPAATHPRPHARAVAPAAGHPRAPAALAAGCGGGGAPDPAASALAAACSRARRRPPQRDVEAAEHLTAG